MGAGADVPARAAVVASRHANDDREDTMRIGAMACAAAIAVLAGGGCGGGSRSSGATTRTQAHTKVSAVSAAPSGTIRTAYDAPSSVANAQAEEVLKVGGTDALARDFTEAFSLPTDITIHAVNQFVGPFWDPSNHSITLSYGFVNYIARTLEQNFAAVRNSRQELGKEVAAVDAFVLAHELGHGLIRVFSLPVLGKEEDAADSLAAVFLTRFVPGGDGFTFDAAKFFHGMSARQRKLAPADYWDVHSLDEQRAYEIVCWVAGSKQADYQAVAKLGILGPARLQTCPSEYQQKLDSWTQLLRPHFRRQSQ
jgi:hypothetical protein